MWQKYFKIGEYQVWVRDDEGPVYQMTKFYGENLDFVNMPDGDGGYLRLSALLALKSL